MATKHITDQQVCEAVREAKGGNSWPYDLLHMMTGEPVKVCYRAMERAHRRGYIEYGMSLRSGWLTESGERTAEGTHAAPDEPGPHPSGG